MIQKLSIIGKGTVGAMSAATFARFTDCDIDWYYDPATPSQAVGEGSTLTLPSLLNECLNFSTRDFPKVDGTIKTGIYKDGWGSNIEPFTHDFPTPSAAMHFNAVKLQDYIADKLKGRVTFIEKNVKHSDIDSSLILDCSGKPKSLDGYTQSKYIPVNAVHVNQCYWDYPKFTDTLAIARPYGWVFGIPLKNRCSVGYMYNKDINTLDEVKDDIKNVFKQFDLIPSNDTNSFTFNNYRKDVNYEGRVIYNGNASYFLEPLEATSFSTAGFINRIANSVWFESITEEQGNEDYHTALDYFEYIIMLHYFAGSKYNSKFWDYAKDRGALCMQEASRDKAFRDIIKGSTYPRRLGTYTNTFTGTNLITKKYQMLSSFWWEGSFSQNMDGLGIRTSLTNLMHMN
jgi:hypothetical protein